METQLTVDGPASPRDDFARVTRPGIGPDELIQCYKEWIEYDKVARVNINGQASAAAAVAKYLPTKHYARILDVAAGTGLAAEQLRELGFTNIDALDPCKEMLDVAREKNLYKNYFCAFFADNVDIIKTSTYDVLIVVGGFAEGHLKCDVLPEMIRCVKPGGLVVLVMNENYLTSVPELKDRLEPRMKQLGEEGQWTRLERTIFPDYGPGCNGVRFVFKITK